MHKLIYTTLIKTFWAVFSDLESAEEIRKCKEAKKTIKKAKSNFVNKAFYIFEFNLKFCKGIQKFKANTTENAAILSNPGEKFESPWIRSVFNRVLPVWKVLQIGGDIEWKIVSEIMTFFDRWLASNCSKEEENQIWEDVMRKNNPMIIEKLPSYNVNELSFYRIARWNQEKIHFNMEKHF